MNGIKSETVFVDCCKVLNRICEYGNEKTVSESSEVIGVIIAYYFGTLSLWLVSQ
jgi:hypothetical protein